MQSNSKDSGQDPERLRITEIFHSLQGEANSVGYPTVFIRLTGCPLRCGYCDTSYAFSGGEWMGLEEILAKLEYCSPGGSIKDRAALAMIEAAEKEYLTELMRRTRGAIKTACEISGKRRNATVSLIPAVSTTADVSSLP